MCTDVTHSNMYRLHTQWKITVLIEFYNCLEKKTTRFVKADNISAMLALVLIVELSTITKI